MRFAFHRLLEPPVARFVSFAALLAIVIFIGILFFQVMIIFLVPIFLAAVLVVIFRPAHLWIVHRLAGRERLAAGLTTVFILVVVLLPMGLIMGRAAGEGWSLVKQLNRDQLETRLDMVRKQLDLDLREEHSATEQIGAALKTLGEDGEAQPTPDEVETRLAEAANGNAILRAWAATREADASAELNQLLDALAGHLARLKAAEPASPDYLREWSLAETAFANVKYEVEGNWAKSSLRTIANPTGDQIETATKDLRDWGERLLAPAAVRIFPFLGKAVFGGLIVIASLYYFLADGPAMLEAMLRLSPLNSVYVKELLAEFGKISRAVVVATLLSALTQGILAGIGFKIAGVEAVFLLTVLTMVGAMVPFVGAAAIWIPTSLWLFLDGHPAAAGGLALYGLLIVSTSDNIIKPLVLHGQSNLHPLLALLSVLGGVAALGPIGIFVGPMAVVFLQVVLQMLNAEMKVLGGRPSFRMARGDRKPARNAVSLPGGPEPYWRRSRR